MDRVLNGAPWTFNNHLLMIHRLKDGDDPLKAFIEKEKKVMFSPGKCYYVDFKYERLTLFCFFYGRLGHNDYFCQAKMDLGVEVAEMRWDLSLVGQSIRALAMNSVWLREEGKRDSRTRIDPMLGLNLEGDMKLVLDMKWDTSKLQGQLDMNHDLEECAIVGGDEKKRPRRDNGSCSEGKASNLIVVRDENVGFLMVLRLRLMAQWEENDEEKQWRFTGFYEAPYAHNRDDLWNLLRNLGYFQQLQ
ncbi:hypothetical protein Gogos_000681 [Gossypium gossypioides]|uniref:Zinc knuckle CX2CX4HX4C domain-containing protein n=1 Tax=Gossypium gossypioides TaxID=34282 RepID=A0A7J9CTF0_GOSGO|nr:hypothetical protein [Gossypium gossypioides]